MVNTIAESASAMNFSTPGQRGKQSVSQLAKEQALMEAVVGTMKDNYLLCFKRMANRYAKLISQNQTDPRDLKLQAGKSMVVEGVNKDNFQGSKFVAKATSAETMQENKAIRQKMRLELYDRLAQRPTVNQGELDKMLAKEADLSFSEQEKLFTPDPAQQAAQQQQPGQPGAPQPGQPQPGQPGAVQPMPSAQQVITGPVQQNAQAQVPAALNAIR